MREKKDMKTKDGAPLRETSGAIKEATAVLRRGGIVAVPTDTVYGLACDPFNEGAVGRLFDAKNREPKPVPLLCADTKVAQDLVELSPTALELARRHWPGALTIVAPLRRETSLPAPVHQRTGHLGVRVPKRDFVVQLARASGGAVTGTSANLSGRSPCRTAAEVVSSLGGRIDMVIDGGRLEGKESTVVKISGDTVEVLREGAVRIREGRPKS